MKPSLQETLDLLIENKIKIFTTVIGFMLVGLLASFLNPAIYTSSMLLKTSLDNQPRQNSLSQLAPLALLTGSGTSEDKAQYALEKLRSLQFAEHFMKQANIAPSVIAAKSYSKENKKIIFNSSIYDQNEDVWNFTNPNGEIGHPSTQSFHEALHGSLLIDQDRITGFIRISYSHISPEFSQYLLTLLVQELNFLEREQEIANSKDAMTFLLKQYENYPQTVIKDSIIYLIENELSNEMSANVEEDYLFEIIDPAFLPQSKDNVSLVKILILFSFIGLSCAIIFLILPITIKDYLKEEPSN